MDPASATVLAAGISGAASVGNMLSTGSMNKKTRDHQKWMYDYQREHALADRAFANEYNSPAAQMDRLKAAGLNPNLVYGNGNAVQTSETTRQSDGGNWKPEAPQFDTRGITSAIAMQYDLELRQAQTEQSKAVAAAAKADVMLKAAQGGKIAAETVKLGIDTDQARANLARFDELTELTFQGMRANVNKTLADTKFTLENNERQKLLTANTLTLGMQSVLNSQSQRSVNEKQKAHIDAQIDVLKTSKIMNEFEIMLNKNGFTKGDPYYIRAIDKIVNDVTNGKTITQAVKSAAKKIGSIAVTPLKDRVNRMFNY